MRLQLVSDLHFEFRQYELGILNALASEEVDLLVVAGDTFNIHDGPKYINRVLDKFSKLWNKVLIIPGNHEYYESNLAQCRSIMSDCVIPQNVTYAQDNQVSVIDGQKFVVGTGWYKKANLEKCDYVPSTGCHMFDTGPRGFPLQFSDFMYIHDLPCWVYQKNEEFGALIQQYADSEAIVVSHHCPSELSVEKKWSGDPTNCFFVDDRTDFIRERQPKLWLHGHTHTAFDYSVGKTRIVCNPVGYPHERNGRIPRVCIIDT